jgi:membrane peptidoglycan carboxypeptidase
MRATDIVRHRRERARRINSRVHRSARGATVLFLIVLLALVVAPLAGVAVGAAGLLALTRELPDVSALEELPARFAPSAATTRLYAWDAPGADGLRHPLLIDEIADPRTLGAGWVRLDDLPAHVTGALLAAEDPSFLSAQSAAPPELSAALLEWLRTGTVGRAHSPIVTELVAAHLRGAPSQPGDEGRALQDWLLGWQIERRYPREQLLEWALNTRYYGHLAYGIEAAARVYFGKSAADLDAGEAALLAMMGRDPAANPFDDPTAARRGQAGVLAMMVAMEAITVEEAAVALVAPLALAPLPGSDSAAPAFARLARRELEDILGPERLLAGGWQVETTLEPILQAQAVCAAARLAGDPAGSSGGGPPCPAADSNQYSVFSDQYAVSGAVVALNPVTGEIEALAGDAAALSPHLSGTLVRPLIYLTALSEGYSPATLTLDAPTIYLQDGLPYRPDNADGQYYGPLRLREALAAGRAAPAAQVLSWVGVGHALATGRALGLSATDPVTDGLDFAESGFSANLLDLGRAYATVANGGTMVGYSSAEGLPRLATVRRIRDAGGEEIYAYQPATREVLDPALAFLLNDILADSEARCPTRACPQAPELPDGRRAAVASGESPMGDAWAIGYTPERLIGVWMGDHRPRDSRRATTDDRQPTTDDGQTNAEALWRALMAWATAGSPIGEWPRPAGLRRMEVCAASGLLPSADADCPTIREWFVPGTEPSATDTMTREVTVNRETSRLATIFTPPQLIERREFTVYPPEATAWADAAGIEPPPTEYDTIRRVPTRDGGAAVLSPEPWEGVSGRWSVVGSAGGEGFSTYRLAYFPGLLPEAMQLIAEGEATVESAELGIWDTTLLEDGLYTLLLTVIRDDGTFDEVAIPISVTNDE